MLRFLLFVFWVSLVASFSSAAVQIELTHPAGKSPKVFTSGWVFGVKCSDNAKDLSSSARWSGTGRFSPAVGSVSRPVFDKPGKNVIIITVEVAGKTTSRRFEIDAVSPDRYAKVGDLAECTADSHGCPSCPHVVSGPITSGSKTVLIGGKAAARVGDNGKHTQMCCGSNTFRITSGDSSVLIDGRPAARLGDRTSHCGGSGSIIGQRKSPNIQGTYVGTLNPNLTSTNLTFTVKGGTVTGISRGRSPYDKSVTDITFKLNGTFDASTMTFSGKVEGYVQSSKKRSLITGTFTAQFEGEARGRNQMFNTIVGQCSIVFEGQKAAMKFLVKRQS